jgi:hypothetical protein
MSGLVTDMARWLGEATSSGQQLVESLTRSQARSVPIGEDWRQDGFTRGGEKALFFRTRASEVSHARCREFLRSIEILLRVADRARRW